MLRKYNLFKLNVKKQGKTALKGKNFLSFKRVIAFISAMCIVFAFPVFSLGRTKNNHYYNPSPQISLEDLLNSIVYVGTENDYTLQNVEKNLPGAITEKTISEEQTIDTEMTVWIGKKNYTITETNETTGDLIKSLEEEMDVAPYIDAKAGRTEVPLRFIAEALGAEVNWNAKNREVTITLDDKTIQLFIPKYDKKGKPINPDNYKFYIVNGTKEEMDVAPQIKNSRTFIPLRFILEALGAEVRWHPEDRSITITRETIEEINKEQKEVNLQYIVNGLTLKEREQLHFPLNKEASQYITDKDLATFLEKYGLTLTSQTQNGLSITANAVLNLNPTRKDNILQGITDKTILKYLSTKYKDAEVNGKDSITNLINKEITNISTEYSMSKTASNTILKGVLKAMDLNYENTDTESIAKELNEMMTNRTYKKDDKGNEITLDSLINEDRIMTLAALNTIHQNIQANLILSQSQSIQQLAKENKLNEAEDFLNTIYKAMESKVNIEGKEVMEKDTTPFKQIIEQLSPTEWAEHNLGEFLYNAFNETAKATGKETVKQNAKLFLALATYRNFIANNYQTIKDKNREEINNTMIKTTERTFKYLTEVEKFREAINNKDEKTINEILNNFGIQNQSKADQQAIWKGIKYMEQTGATQINYNNLTTLTLMHLFNFQYSDIKQMSKEINRGEPLEQIIENQTPFSNEQMTNLIETLFLRELTVSGYTARDIFPKNDPFFPPIMKNPDQKLNILNDDETKGAPAPAIITQMLGWGLFIPIKNGLSNGTFPNGQPLIALVNARLVKDWPSDQDNLAKILTLLTGPLTSYATSPYANLERLRTPFAWGTHKMRAILENALGIPHVDDWSVYSDGLGRNVFRGMSLIFNNSTIEWRCGGDAQAKYFFKPSSSDKKINRIIKGVSDSYGSPFQNQEKYVENALYISNLNPFSLPFLTELPSRFVKDEVKVTEGTLFYEPNGVINEIP